ncbi:hypothetical protein [Nocardiopsis alkaliphila]|uniref:hypothetical protein n=1 Tax=Nocardiopsis alkaliphila TaxID=225762 RepID=UPI00034AB8EC|nr:hypothetical protein [Nocardiopsis alkaliphila]
MASEGLNDQAAAPALIPSEHQGETVPEPWDHVDALILTGRTIQAAQAIRKEFGPLSMRDTIEALGERFEYLRDTRPDEFAVNLDGYWDGFYS